MTCALQVQKREDLEEKPYDHDTRDLPLSSSLLSELQPLLDEAMGLPSLMKKGAKSLSDIRVVVAMSGGVDSSVAAVWLARAGYDVIGVTLQLYDHGEALAKKGTCCAGQDIKDARRVAEQAGFPHYVMDYESLFRKEVIESFADDYLAGQTPIPCVRCNQTVKFRDLYKLAHDMGVDALVTGHYVRRVMGPHGARLHRALDATRDQSYFLFATTQDQLDFLRFPLGGLPKARVRELARELGVQVAEKPDSQDICFVPQGRYTYVIRRLRPGTEKPGEIVHEDGRVLGQHKGIISYTIGQRRGLGIAEGDPLFVTKLDVKQHRVIVGPRSSLLVKSLSLKEVNWLGKGAFGPQLEGQSVWVKTRSTRHPVSACFRKGGQGLVLDFEHPEEGVAPGQACVFYDSPDDHARLLGGGWIIRQDATS